MPSNSPTQQQYYHCYQIFPPFCVHQRVKYPGFPTEVAGEGEGGGGGLGGGKLILNHYRHLNFKEPEKRK